MPPRLDKTVSRRSGHLSTDHSKTCPFRLDPRATVNIDYLQTSLEFVSGKYKVGDRLDLAIFDNEREKKKQLESMYYLLTQ